MSADAATACCIYSRQFRDAQMSGRRLRVEGDYRGVGLCYAEGTAKRGDLP